MSRRRTTAEQPSAPQEPGVPAKRRGPAKPSTPVKGRAQAERSAAVRPAWIVPPLARRSDRAAEFDDYSATEIARRLVGLPSGRAWERVKERDGAGRYWGPPGSLWAFAADRESGPAGAVVAAAFGIALAVAELSGSVFGAVPGAIFDAGLASILLIGYVWRPRARSAQLLPVLALVALIRPIGLAAVVPKLPPLAWYAFAGLPLLVGAVLAARLVTEPVLELHLRIERPRLDAAVVVGGLVGGLVGYLLLAPAPLLAHPGPTGYLALVVVLVVFGGLIEELIFRGLVLGAAIPALGSTWKGVAFTSALSMTLYWGSGSIGYMFLMAVTGGLFALALSRGASLWGVVLSHGAMLVTIALLAQGAGR